MIQFQKYQTLIVMEKQNEPKHFYVLPDGQIVKNQLEGRNILGIGRNAFRNRVKSGVIKRISTNDKPQGYNDEKAINSPLRQN